MRKYINYIIPEKALLLVALLVPLCSMAQYPTIKLSFVTEDTLKVCKAVVMNSATEPGTELGVTFFVKRVLGLLPIGNSVATDENGVAKVNFPVSIPVDENGIVTVMARLEDNEEVAVEAISPWGMKRNTEDVSSQNAIWSSRSNVAITLMIISNLIIVGIWGVMAYVVYLVFFRIPKVGLNNQT